MTSREAKVCRLPCHVYPSSCSAPWPDASCARRATAPVPHRRRVAGFGAGSWIELDRAPQCSYHPATFTVPSMEKTPTSMRHGLIIGLSVVLLAGTTVLWQEQHLGLHYVEGEQWTRHQTVLDGSAPNPWRYRVLAEWMAEGFVRVARMLHTPRPIATGFLGLRLVQNALIFLLAYAYYRRVKLERRQALVGVMVLAAALTYAVDNSDLSFNTYFDVAFYLLATVLLLDGRVPLFLLVVVAASLNRETSGFIPLLPLADWIAHPRTPPGNARGAPADQRGGPRALGDRVRRSAIHPGLASHCLARPLGPLGLGTRRGPRVVPAHVGVPRPHALHLAIANPLGIPASPKSGSGIVLAGCPALVRGPFRERTRQRNTPLSRPGGPRLHSRSALQPRVTDRCGWRTLRPDGRSPLP